MKISVKYSLFLGGLLILSAGAITGLAVLRMRDALRREALLRAESIAVNLGLVGADAILTGQVLQLLPLATDATTRHENVVYAAVTDNDNVVLAHPDRDALRKPFQFTVTRGQEDFGIQSRVTEGLALGRRVWDVSVPVKSKGSTVELGRVHVGLDRRAVEDSVRRSLVRLLEVALLFLAGGMALTVVFVRLMVRPLQSLSSASTQIGLGNRDVTVNVSSRDELGELAANFNQMVVDLRMAEVRRRAAERVESELRMAHSIQKDLFPSQEPSLEGWETAFSWTPATELGGDLYDWYPVAGGRKMGFMIADVSGKGVPAALHSATLRSLMRSASQSLEGPDEVLRHVNKQAFADLHEKAFVTMIYGVLDPADGSFEFVNAGHDPLLCRRADGELVSLESGTFPIGLVDADDFDAMAQAQRLVLGPGDLLFLFTDGVTEAEDDGHRQFGLDRIGSLLNGGGAHEAVRKVREELQLYIGGKAPHDDVTLLAIQRKKATAPR